MKPDEIKAGQTTSTEAVPNNASILEDVQALWYELRALGHDYVKLAGLDMRRAGESLVMMIAASIILGIMLISAWLGFLATAVLALINVGMTASNAILLIVAVNLLAALILLRVIRHKSRYLLLPDFLGSLQPTPVKRGHPKKL
jgi:hypothetical protein